MNKKSKIMFSLVSVMITSMIMNVGAWPNDDIYVQDIGDREINIDGEVDGDEWKTEEETYRETLSGLSVYNATSIEFQLIMLRNSNNLYIYIQFKLNNNAGYSENVSIGFATSDKSIGLMRDSLDRKIFYHNGTDGVTTRYDLHSCSLVGNECEDVSRSLQPGVIDQSEEGTASFGVIDDKTGFFEISIPLKGDGSVEDVEIKEGTTFKFVINPYSNLYLDDDGHGNVGTQQLEIRFSSRPFFERPEGPMDALAMFFNTVFAIIIITISLLFYFSARNDALAEKLYKIEITEEMANKSLLLEIGYYNSSFISLFSLLYFWAYAAIGVAFGIWANWGVPGLIINGSALLISTYVGIDLIKRNHNPQDIPKEDRKSLGKDIEKTGSLWFFAPGFLGLTLFMLVFIGIDVVS